MPREQCTPSPPPERKVAGDGNAATGAENAGRVEERERKTVAVLDAFTTYLSWINNMEKVSLTFLLINLSALITLLDNIYR